MVVMAAAEAGHSNLVRLFLNQAHLIDGWERRNEIFFEVSRRGFVSIVRMMLEEENVDVNQVRWLTQDTALQHAAANGQLKVVKILLDAGAQPCDTDGNALYRAAKHGHEEVVKVLIEHGYDIDGFGAEDTALVTAAEKGHFRMVKLLINLGADLTARHCGEIALHRAAANNHADVARLLIEKGVNIDGVEKRLAPMLGALVMEHDGIVQMLKDMGAKNVQAMASLYAKRVVDGEHPNETYRSSPDWPRSMGTSSRKSSLAA
jgi:ankyrin repeat protein